MLKLRFLLVIATVAMFVSGAIAAGSLRCSVCGKKIEPGSNYYTYKDKKICSKKCLNKYTQKYLPKCAKCGKPIIGTYYQKDGRNYCSKECLSSCLPKCVKCGAVCARGVIFLGDKKNFYCPHCASGPKCFCCSLPGDCTKLQDGRYICSNCIRDAIFDYNEAKTVYDDVRHKMKRALRLSTSHNIDFRTVGAQELKSRTTRYNPGLELGLYIYAATIEKKTTQKVSLTGEVRESKTETRKTREDYSILVLYGISLKKLREVIAHELAHDWMQANYPEISDLKIKEGWAEYIAYRMNKVYRQEEFNPRIEMNPDKVYGDGFRYIRDIAQRRGMSGLRILFDKYNKQ